MKIHTNVINVATETAKKSDVVRGKVGAVCFTNKGHIIAFAHNAILYGHKKHFTIHAEIALLAKLVKLRAGARFGIKNLNILVVRYRAEDDALGIAKPCVNCRAALKITGMKVFYSDTHANIVELRNTK